MEPSAGGRWVSWEQLMKDFDRDLSQLKAKERDLITFSSQAIFLALKYLNILNTEKPHVQEDEIPFYKTVKPHFQSQLLYHRKIYEVETSIPEGNIYEVGYFLQRELDKLKEFYEKHKLLYRYIRSGAEFLDFLFFTRGKQMEVLLFWIEETDVNCDTPFDLLISKIKAAELIQQYLLDKMEHYTENSHLNAEPQKVVLHPKNVLQWTDSKAHLVELIYGLQRKGCFENGQARVMDIVRFFEEHFGIRIGNPHRIMQDVRLRKEQATFTKSLLKSVQEYMDETDLTYKR